MLEVKELSVRYNPDDPSPALSGVSFSLRKGERLALLGNNGAGKSTLLLTLAGILVPEQGSISIDGLELDRRDTAALRQKTGLVMQNPDDQLFMSTVFDDVAFGLRSRKTPEAETAVKTAEVMAALGIAGLRDRLTHRLSGGEKRLAALAGILVMEPAILLLDEPATFLDPPGRERLIAILSALPHGMIIATHDLDLASRLCGGPFGYAALDHGRLTAYAGQKDADRAGINSRSHIQ
jgi:cobalt/nickel transport system ATP-binding protein